jgi:hypothetical protein
MLISENSLRTSSPTPPARAGFLSAPEAEAVGISDILPVVVSTPLSGQFWQGLDQYSGKRTVFDAFVTVNSPNVTSHITTYFGDIDYVAVSRGEENPVQRWRHGTRLMRFPEVSTRPVYMAWGWGVAFSTGVAQGVSELRRIVSGIRNHSPLNLSPTVEGLIDQAVGRRGTPQDVRGWARGIADDVADLSD